MAAIWNEGFPGVKKRLLQVGSKQTFVPSVPLVYDWVTIYDGPNEQSNQIVKLTGSMGIFDISSTGRSLFIKFESISGNGAFHATIYYGKSYFKVLIPLL